MRIILYWLSAMLVASLASAQTNLVVTGPVSATPGDLNTLVGVRAGMTNTSATTGTDNTFSGAGTGQRNTTGSRGTFFGSNAGGGNTTGNDNTLLGAYVAFSGSSTQTASGNTFAGSSSAERNSMGANNTYVGYKTGNYLNAQNENVFLGYQAGGQSSEVWVGNGSINSNTFVGYQAGYYIEGPANTIIGYKAGSAYTTGVQFNTFVGTQAGLNNTSGNANIMLGTNAGVSNSTGSGNFFLGDYAGGANTKGGFNVYLGTNAGNGTDVNGINNVAVGFESGRNNNSNSNIYPSDGSNNTFLGFRADISSSSLRIRNSTAVGPNALIGANNSLILGNGANVGIGTSQPYTKLELVSNNPGSSGLRLTNLTLASSTSLTMSRFLTVNEQGDVLLANSTGGARLASASLWESRLGGLSPEGDAAVMIGQLDPSQATDYNLLVNKGILTERLKVAIKDTQEWSDHVFTPAYKLPTLSQVERYITQHHHLPGVASAQEMVEMGNDLHHTDAVLLAKIEELTLYVIEADRWDKQQQQEINRLRAENRRINRQLNRR